MKIWQLFENFNLAELNANFAELLASINGAKATYLTANKAVYVATTGSDTTGDGTSGKPYKTIAKGLSVIPKNLNGYDISLYIAGGTYAENVLIKGFHGGILSVILQGNVVINSLSTQVNQMVSLGASIAVSLAITNTVRNALELGFGSNVKLANTISLVLTSDKTVDIAAIYCQSFSHLDIEGTVTITNSKYAVLLTSDSKAYIFNLVGTNNTIGIWGDKGSQFSYVTKTIAATTEKLLTGGAIITNLITMP